MGGVVTINPTAVPAGGGWRDHTGASVGAAAPYLADVSDTTYLTDSALASSGTTALALELEDIPSLPVGAAVRSVTPRIRASQAVGARGLVVSAYREGAGDTFPTYYTPQATIVPTATIKDYLIASGGAIPARVADWAGTPMTAEDYLNNLRMEVTLAGGGTAAEDHRLYKASVDVAYVEPPTVDTLAPVSAADLTSTVRPRLKWNYNTPDGFPQYEFRAVIWALADVTGFPGGRAAFEANVENLFSDSSGFNGYYGPAYTKDGGATVVRAKAWSTASPDSPYPARRQQSEQLWTPQQDIPGSGQFVAYVQSAAQFADSRLEGPAVASLDFTMDVVPPDPPTSVVATWQYPQASASVDRNAQYRTKIDVVAPSASSLSGFTGRRLYVEHCIDGADDWRLMPMAMKELGLSGGTFTFYDTMPLPGRTLRYRAKVELYSASLVLPSTYATGNAVDCIIDEFLLRNPLDADSTVVLRIQGDLKARGGEALGELRALGQGLPTFVSDAVLGFRWSISLLGKNQDTSAALHALRASRSVLLFQGDMPDWWYWVRIGSETEHTLVRQINRRNATKRAEFHDLELIQTYPIAGQPGVWF